MKSTNYKSGKNRFSSFCLLMLLATTIGFAQENKNDPKTTKAKSDLSNTNTNTNPYYANNELAGENPSLMGNNTNSNGQVNRNKGSISNVLKTKHDTAKNSIGNIR